MPKDIRLTALQYIKLFEELRPFSSVIERSLAKIAERPLLLDKDIPDWLRLKILSFRPEFIDAEVIGSFDLDHAFALIQNLSNESVTPSLFYPWLTIPPDANSERLLNDYFIVVFRSALELTLEGSLQKGWRTLLRKHGNVSEQTIDLKNFSSTSELAVVADLLGYPFFLDSSKQAQIWSEAILVSKDDASEQNRACLLVYVTLVAFRSQTETSKRLLLFAFADLREVVLRDSLNDEMRRLLQANLPDIGYGNWNLGQRLLIALRNFDQAVPIAHQLVESLHLSENDRAILENRDQSEKTEAFTFWPKLWDW